MDNIRKRDLKDIAHQMMIEALKSFDVAFEDSEISEDDKKYIFKIIEKHQQNFANKITDLNYLNIFSVDDLVEYANTHKVKGNG